MNYLNISYPDVNNGSGCRVTLWVAGCPHHCPECHNPESWDFNNGNTFTEKEIYDILEISKLDYITGLTISGGDPLVENNYETLLNFLNIITTLQDSPFNTNCKLKKTIWLYTGYVWEKLTDKQKEIVSLIDVLIDGPYIKSLRDLSLPFRGSSNQRIIDVQNSLKDNKVILYNNFE